MNTNDLHTLLTAPALSRTLFFSRLLARPRPQAEPPIISLPPTADTLPAAAASTPPLPTSRPA